MASKETKRQSKCPGCKADIESHDWGIPSAFCEGKLRSSPRRTKTEVEEEEPLDSLRVSLRALELEEKQLEEEALCQKIDEKRVAIERLKAQASIPSLSTPLDEFLAAHHTYEDITQPPRDAHQGRPRNTTSEMFLKPAKAHASTMANKKGFKKSATSQSATSQSTTSQSATSQSATSQSATSQSATSQSATSQSATSHSAASQSMEQIVVKNEASPIIAYLHNLSPIKTSQRNNMYFDMKLQTNSKTIRSVCFSAEKHSAFKKKYEASSPIKISNYSLKKNSTTNDDEIHINKRTKLDEPQDDEVNFDITQEATPQIPPTTDVNEVLTSNKSQVSVVGRVVFHGPVETISTKGKLLRKQEASITDDTALIRVVLWENDISKISSDSSYKLYKVMVKNYQDNRYLTLNKQTLISQISQQFERENDVHIQHQFQTVHCPADGVNSVHSFLSCKKCHTKVIPQGNIVKCSECGLAQLQQKCSSKYLLQLNLV